LKEPYIIDYRNLLVAATGTGKTVVSDYKNFRSNNKSKVTFVAHRKRYLQQAKATFQGFF
jgi:superfamily II DNA or RNA helicase